jgi:hypothetical protein
MVRLEITSGGKGKPAPKLPIFLTNNISDRGQAAASLLSDAFKSDPTITYILSSMIPLQCESFRPKLFKGLLTAATQNQALIHEVNNRESC